MKPKKKTGKFSLVSRKEAKRMWREKKQRAVEIRKIKRKEEKDKRKLILVKPNRPAYIVTGNPEPDCTGNYFVAGTYNGHPYYRNAAGFYLWSNIPANASFIAAVPGDCTDNYWDYDDAGIVGYYAPHGSVSGTPHVVAGRT